MNIFGINLTSNEQIPVYDGDCFVTKRIDEEQNKLFEQAQEDIFRIEKKSGLPAFLQICVWICGITAIMIIVGIIKAMAEGVSFAQGFNNAPVLYILVPVLAIICLALTVYQKKRRISYETSDAKQELDNKLNSLTQSSLSFLGAPERALEFDVLSFLYTVKDGIITLTHKKAFDYSLEPMYAFVENNNFCLCSLFERMDIPLSEIKKVSLVKLKATADCWNKKDTPDNYQNGGKIAIDRKMGTVHFAPYYSVKIVRDNEEYEMLFPFWEYNSFSSLTGISAFQDDESYDEL